MTTLLIGCALGLLASALGWLLVNTGWPYLFHLLLYKGIVISGKWEIYERVGSELCLVGGISLRQIGNRVTGSGARSRTRGGKPSDRRFVYTGRLSGEQLTLVFDDARGRDFDTGTYVFRVENNGVEMTGMATFHGKPENRIVSEYRLLKREGAVVTMPPREITGWLRRPANQETVVVFIHGILSDGTQCWTSASGANWPKLLADEPTLNDVGIFSFSYKTSAFSKTYNLGDVVDSLKEEMRLAGLDEFSRVVFVCHSMGGIVARRYLVSQQAELIESQPKIGLFLVASPSLGSVQANLLYPLIGLLRNTQASILRFNQQNVWLNDLDKDFVNLLHSRKLDIRGKELVEDKPIELFRRGILGLTLNTQTVPPYSAARYFGDPYKVPDSNHLSICKPTSPKEIQHRLLVEFVSSIAAVPIAPITFSIPKGWTLGDVAEELANLDKDGGILRTDELTEQERNAELRENRLVANSISEALEALQRLTFANVREYRVDKTGKEYRFRLL